MYRYCLPTIITNRSRANFKAMEPYFNEVCEAYFLQTKEADGFPSVSELAALYFEVSELEAVSYLLGTERGGTDCHID